MISRINSIVAFLEVAERLNFVAAAAELNITPSTLSRKIKELEGSMETQLLYRTTRQVTLTEAGIKLYDHCKQAFVEIEKAELEIALLGKAPRGLLRVSAPMTFAQLHLSPLLPSFMKENPDISIELILSDEYVDFVKERIDVAIRIGELSDSSFVARKLASNNRVLVASPEYLEKHGIPKTPHDLVDHNCMIPSFISPDNSWQLVKGNTKKTIKVSGNLRTNNAVPLHETALGGIGIALLATFIVQQDLEEDRLIQLLPDWQVEPCNIYAIYSYSNFVAPKIKSFVEFFVKQFSPVPSWDAGVN